MLTCTYDDLPHIARSCCQHLAGRTCQDVDTGCNHQGDCKEQSPWSSEGEWKGANVRANRYPGKLHNYIIISLLYYTQKCVKLLVHGGSLGCSQCDSCETIMYFITRLCIIRIAYLFPLQAKYPSLIHSVRGVGTFCAFDCYSTETRNKLVPNLRNRGDYYACFNYLRLLVARCTRLHIVCVLQVPVIVP